MIKRNKSPKSESPFPEEPANVSKIAPAAPIKIPATFERVIFSLIRK
jgi:hypothetical protein